MTSSSSTIYDIPVRRIDGADTTLAEHRGEVLLVVNVASECGFTPQYEGLEKLYETYQGQGFTVLGFPANDFLGQEPGSDAEIQAFCTATFGVRFPMFSKVTVAGPDKHALFAHLTTSLPDAAGRESMEEAARQHGAEAPPRPEIIWNFEKFLVSRTGETVARFAPDTAPDAPQLVTAIEQALADT
ncbi:MAG: glutathione peroxidase [Gammaproteobacteria bacterium]|nr:glutathione peroxidase [Gammaproteobacteria bacterium]